MNKFELGQVVMTRTINDTIADNEQFAKDVTNSLQRYVGCDWGDIEAEDKAMNDEAIQTGEDRIFAAYLTSKGKVYIITEWDRSVTTVLFANEY